MGRPNRVRFRITSQTYASSSSMLPLTPLVSDMALTRSLTDSTSPMISSMLLRFPARRGTEQYLQEKMQLSVTVMNAWSGQWSPGRTSRPGICVSSKYRSATPPPRCTISVAEEGLRESLTRWPSTAKKTEPLPPAPGPALDVAIYSSAGSPLIRTDPAKRRRAFTSFHCIARAPPRTGYKMAGPPRHR